MANICFQMICFQADAFLAPVLEAIAPYAPVVVTEGPVAYFAAQGYHTSTDRTREILETYVPRQNIVYGQWREKDEMMNAAEHLIPPDTTHVWMVDADEVWTPESIESILAQLDKYDSVAFKPRTFFGGFEHVLTGFEMRAEWIRIQRWHRGAHWATHRPPTVNAPDGKPYRGKRHWDAPHRFNHYSYVFPSQVKSKVAYYESWGAGVIPHWFERVYLPWVLGDDAQKRAVEQEFQGVHEWLPERRGECFTAPFMGKHPSTIQRRMGTLEGDFQWEIFQLGMERGTL